MNIDTNSIIPPLWGIACVSFFTYCQSRWKQKRRLAWGAFCRLLTHPPCSFVKRFLFASLMLMQHVAWNHIRVLWIRPLGRLWSLQTNGFAGINRDLCRRWTTALFYLATDSSAWDFLVFLFPLVTFWSRTPSALCKKKWCQTQI